MLYHHGPGSYEEAASAAAADARAKLETLIENGKRNAAAVVEQVENQQPVDAIIYGDRVKVTPDLMLDAVIAETEKQKIHRHALAQMAEVAGVKDGYARALFEKGDWGKELLATNLNELFKHDEKRHLVRVVDGEVRGFLSDKFRRRDARPLLDAFIGACQLLGAVPVDGHALETKVAVKAVLPVVFEPVPNEIVGIGIQFGTSDFGHGAQTLRTLLLRLWCTNFATLEEMMREVHVGGRISEDFEYSERTMRLDTAASASAIRDVVKSALAPERVAEVMDGIRAANEAKIDSRSVGAFLKARLNKSETAAAVEKFNSPDVELLPPGNTMWRLSNAVSWLAGETKDGARKLELEQVAGELLRAEKEKAA